MVPIFLASVTPYVGKNVVALGLAQKLGRDKKSIGYFKPLGPLPIHSDGVVADEDAVFFKKVLNLSEPLNELCPVVLTDEAIAAMLGNPKTNVRDRLLAAFETVSRGKDVVLTVSMGRLSCGTAFGYSMDQFVKDVNARVIAVAKYHWLTETLDGILHIRNLVPKNFAGAVFNRIAPSQVSHVKEAVRPFLKARGVDVLCVAADDPILNAVEISELVEELNGKVLCGGDKLHQLAENFSIGAMNVDSALRIFQHVPHKAVITGGDRADIQLAALETSTRCLILTGDLYPNERILTHAEELGVPVIMVSQDTSATVAICDQLRRHMSMHSDTKLARASELIDRSMDWDLLHKNVGI